MMHGYVNLMKTSFGTTLVACHFVVSLIWSVLLSEGYMEFK